jgi:hypothetical protein
MMCERESQAVAARLSGQWPAGLTQHVAQCPDCQDALMVSSFLSECPGAGSAEVPAADLVWFKAKLRLRREAVERAERPLVWGQRVVAAIAGGAMLWGAAWSLGTNATLAASLIGSCLVLGLTAGGLLLAARERK